MCKEGVCKEGVCKERVCKERGVVGHLVVSQVDRIG